MASTRATLDGSSSPDSDPPCSLVPLSAPSPINSESALDFPLSESFFSLNHLILGAASVPPSPTASPTYLAASLNILPSTKS